MTGTRDAVLQAVRAALGGVPRDPQAIAAEAAALLEAPEAIRPRLPAGDRVALFAERVVSPKVSATLDRVARLEELPEAVRRHLAAQDLPPAVALQPTAALQGLDWRGIETHTSMAADEAVGVGLARWGIAETGSLVFHSGPGTPILFNFLPLHHVVALPARRILAHLEDYAAAAAGEPAPRNVNLITGISGTTDIEGSYVRGAHGPRFLHVIIVDERPA
jgi:L-lactate dehydrogenase complex protein LldG